MSSLRRFSPTEARRRFEAVDERYQYQARRRDTFDWAKGFPAAAMSGDRKALRTCAAMVRVMLLKRTEWPDDHDGLRIWLWEAISQIEAGIEPNEAFGWSRRTAGAPAAFESLQRRWLVMRAVAALAAEQPDLPRKVVFGRVAEALSLTDEAVRKIWREAGELADF